MIMNAVAWGADMICVCSVDPVTIQQGLQEAADAGIMVTTCSTGIFSPNPSLQEPIKMMVPPFLTACLALSKAFWV